MGLRVFCAIFFVAKSALVLIFTLLECLDEEILFSQLYECCLNAALSQQITRRISQAEMLVDLLSNFLLLFLLSGSDGLPDGLHPTPPMGWTSWNTFFENNTEEKMISQVWQLIHDQMLWENVKHKIHSWAV